MRKGEKSPNPNPLRRLFDGLHSTIRRPETKKFSFEDHFDPLLIASHLGHGWTGKVILETGIRMLSKTTPDGGTWHVGVGKNLQTGKCEAVITPLHRDWRDYRLIITEPFILVVSKTEQEEPFLTISNRSLTCTISPDKIQINYANGQKLPQTIDLE